MEPSNMKRGLKRISIFASLAWGAYWFYIKISSGTLFGIRYYKEEYIYLGLLVLAGIWITQFFGYWIFSGFVKNEREIASENEEIKEDIKKTGTSFLKGVHDVIHGILSAIVYLFFLGVIIAILIAILRAVFGR
jgi:hypothetical protein